MDEERWQESLNARNTLAANQAIYAAWSAAWTAEATDNTINIYKHFTSRGQRCPYTLQIVDAFSRQCAANIADVAMYTSDVLEEAFYALINDHSISIEDNYDDFFFEELPGGEKIHDHLDNIYGAIIELRIQTQTTKTDTDPAALLFLREAKRLGKKRQREQLQAHQEQHQDTQQRKRTRTRQRRTPLLMPMDASSTSDKKRKVIEGESSPRGLKRMRFG